MGIEIDFFLCGVKIKLVFVCGTKVPGLMIEIDSVFVRGPKITFVSVGMD